ncbi:hypothetical protein DFH11DRAFT_164016 [Phellopilus nigrolimitatus]|nr:hypothetical protein DFH11DRAFT_164016 [Phellopilus nigrolimitatus]
MAAAHSFFSTFVQRSAEAYNSIIPQRQKAPVTPKGLKSLRLCEALASRPLELPRETIRKNSSPAVIFGPSSPYASSFPSTSTSPNLPTTISVFSSAGSSQFSLPLPPSPIEPGLSEQQQFCAFDEEEDANASWDFKCAAGYGKANGMLNDEDDQMPEVAQDTLTGLRDSLLVVSGAFSDVSDPLEPDSGEADIMDSVSVEEAGTFRCTSGALPVALSKVESEHKVLEAWWNDAYLTGAQYHPMSAEIFDNELNITGPLAREITEAVSVSRPAHVALAPKSRRSSRRTSQEHMLSVGLKKNSKRDLAGHRAGRIFTGVISRESDDELREHNTDLFNPDDAIGSTSSSTTPSLIEDTCSSVCSEAPIIKSSISESSIAANLGALVLLDEYSDGDVSNAFDIARALREDGDILENIPCSDERSFISIRSDIAVSGHETEDTLDYIEVEAELYALMQFVACLYSTTPVAPSGLCSMHSNGDKTSINHALPSESGLVAFSLSTPLMLDKCVSDSGLASELADMKTPRSISHRRTTSAPTSLAPLSFKKKLVRNIPAHRSMPAPMSILKKKMLSAASLALPIKKVAVSTTQSTIIPPRTRERSRKSSASASVNKPKYDSSRSNIRLVTSPIRVSRATSTPKRATLRRPSSLATRPYGRSDSTLYAPRVSSPLASSCVLESPRKPLVAINLASMTNVSATPSVSLPGQVANDTLRHARASSRLEQENAPSTLRSSRWASVNVSKSASTVNSSTITLASSAKVGYSRDSITL